MLNFASVGAHRGFPFSKTAEVGFTRNGDSKLTRSSKDVVAAIAVVAETKQTDNIICLAMRFSRTIQVLSS